ncbi:hypothetical protein SAMD00019534_089170 [Acytostelium subglobosum LB1]|uniref:hypothetical protein n=1 Tax=Acytostelium subglobosum LB1 TaxID=1410327 RepID=UPI0006451AE9|nr:hypothetical protein SAMD00019534_089170 [Acytostelium subglobosum LB1]GAM25742.1 hypothetical protein SAMD00019534_089170 [Acytostelium subglobosum LB1]|eukprot:XP_012751260.1 hypothetical protein SAMD00019534_089170 [Acytostelium subglobosum LB1]
MSTSPNNSSNSLATAVAASSPSQFSTAKGTILRGYLSKKGHVIKNWKLRLFVLKIGSNYIEYYVDESKESTNSPRGKIPLYNCRCAEYVHTKNNNPREYCFNIETFEGKSWIISAGTKDQQVQWIESIKEAASYAEETDESKLAKHKQIEKMIQDDMRHKSRVPIIKLLLLGTGESGKSTVVKQMKILHSKGFTDEEKDFYRRLVHRNVIDGMAILVHTIQEHGIQVAPETRAAIEQFASWFQVYQASRPSLRLSNNHSPMNTPKLTSSSSSISSTSISPNTSFNLNDAAASSSELGQLSTSFEANASLVEDKGIPTHISELINKIWSDSIVQTDVIIKAQRYHINDSVKYYLNELSRLIKADYTPTSFDILSSRSQTTGVIETDFKVADVMFKIVDVGGQRGERKKWIHFFEDVTAIVYVAAINEYDQMLVEDGSANRLQESLTLFDQVCNDASFPNSSVILFLNKIDLFQEKLKRISMQTCFPEYKEDQTYERASNYIKNLFLSKRKQSSKFVYSHFTCATDTKSFEKVFSSVQDIILSNVLDATVV